jgi:RimJ/RimL family protein N-acetyltransferase
MAGIIPQPFPDNRTRIAYAVLCQSRTCLQNEKSWEIAGIITLLSSAPEISVDAADTRHTHVTQQSVNIGYLFLPSTWGHGFATESLRKLLELYKDVSVTEMNTDVALYAYVHSDNTRSVRVVQKLGLKETSSFKQENRLRQKPSCLQQTVLQFCKHIH